jgi:hypothetical protein
MWPHSLQVSDSMQTYVCVYRECPVSQEPWENPVIWKNVKREKLWQIMCFQSQVFEFCTLDEPLWRYTLDTSVIKCYGDVAMLIWWWNNLVVWSTTAKCSMSTKPHMPIEHHTDCFTIMLTWQHRHNILLQTCQECSAVTARSTHKTRTLVIGNTWFGSTFPSLHFSIFCQITVLLWPGFMRHSVYIFFFTQSV